MSRTIETLSESSIICFCFQLPHIPNLSLYATHIFPSFKHYSTFDCHLNWYEWQADRVKSGSILTYYRYYRVRSMRFGNHTNTENRWAISKSTHFCYLCHSYDFRNTSKENTSHYRLSHADRQSKVDYILLSHAF